MHHMEAAVRVEIGTEDHVIQEHLSEALLELGRNNSISLGFLLFASHLLANTVLSVFARFLIMV